MTGSSLSGFPRFAVWLARYRTACFSLSLVLLGAVVYANALDGDFLFDDKTQIVDNETVHSLSWPWRFMANVRRPLLNLTLAVNYALGQDKTLGYHLCNVIIHVLSGLFLFGCLSRALRFPTFDERTRCHAPYLAFAATALWLVHPLQTQSVTYVIQRAESLMGMFFLASCFCAFKYFEGRRRVWCGWAVVAGLAAGLVKEVAVMLPMVVLLFDLGFVSRSWKQLWRDHKYLYLGYGGMWVMMFALFFLTAPEQKPTAGFLYKGISPWAYAVNQPPIIFHYIKLVFWPRPLIFDYNLPRCLDKGVLFVSSVALASWLAAALLLFRRVPKVVFPCIAGMLILVPSSSFIPLKDLAFEHRMYLTSAGIIIMAVCGLYVLLRRVNVLKEHRWEIAWLMFYVVLSFLSFETYQRNKDYQTEARMWQDVVDKNPGNARAYNNLGFYYYAHGHPDLAAGLYLQALAEDRNYADPYLNYGTYLSQKGKFAESIPWTAEAIRLDAEYAIAYNNLGAAYSDLEDFERSIPYYRKALELGFERPGVHVNLGLAYAKTGQPRLALDHFYQAHKKNASFPHVKDYIDEVQQRMMHK